MIKQNPAQIYLADTRKQWLSEGYNCWSTFNVKNNQEATNNVFGSLFLFDYQILAPNKKATFVTQANCLFYLIPLFGGINIQSNQEQALIITQQSQQIATDESIEIVISNPFEENVSFLLLGFQSESVSLENKTLSFDFSIKNKLVTLLKNDITTISIGQFDGRYESQYQLNNPGKGIFAYIIQGAFEFENRLLETSDALSIKNIDAVEWEALSENAMILIIEIPNI